MPNARFGRGRRSPHRSFERVVHAFAGDQDVTTGTMMASLGLKVNGRIFAMLVRGRLVVKLPRARVDELVKARRGSRFDPRRDGRLMKEWIVLKGESLPWVDIAHEAYRFVKGV
jgi:hypothetical protein